jgi:monoamine oxidase
MTRKEFVKICGVLGIGLPMQTALVSCGSDEPAKPAFDGKVIIIGAGAGGLSAGYLLQQQGTDFEILEASSVYGGRMRVNTDFADFPIPLGAEWIETGTGIFQEIVNDNSVQVDIETIADAPDQKFVNSSWYGFFEEFIVPSIADKIVYNTVIQSIDYSSDQVIITTQNGEYTADKVIVAVPLKILQDGDISFLPSLPGDKLDAINSTTIWEGFKAFFEFSENFYDEGHEFVITPESDGEKIYYDAALGQNTSKHILGLFVVGKPALDFSSRSGNELRDFILSELDALYDNRATATYLKHLTQDWNDEPFIKAGYMTDHADWRTVRTLGESVASKVYFAGGAYTDGEDWVSVHTAAQSASKAVAGITG